MAYERALPGCLEIFKSICHDFILKASRFKISSSFTVRERSSITSARLGGVGGQSKNADTDDTLKETGGIVERSIKYCCLLLEIINKVMNFFLNNALISLNTACHNSRP